MNEIANKFLLTGDKFMPEINLRQLVLEYSAWRPLKKQRKNSKI